MAKDKKYFNTEHARSELQRALGETERHTIALSSAILERAWRTLRNHGQLATAPDYSAVNDENEAQWVRLGGSLSTYRSLISGDPAEMADAVTKLACDLGASTAPPDTPAKLTPTTARAVYPVDREEMVQFLSAQKEEAETQAAIASLEDERKRLFERIHESAQELGDLRDRALQAWHQKHSAEMRLKDLS